MVLAMTATAKNPELGRHLRELEESLLQPDFRKSRELVELLADNFIEFGSTGRVYRKAALVPVLQAYPLAQAQAPGVLQARIF